MRLRAARFLGFKGLENLQVSFATRVTAFVGGNGSGKTALLQGLTGALFPKCEIPFPVRFSESQGYVELEISLTATEWRRLYHEVSATVPPPTKFVELERTTLRVRRQWTSSKSKADSQVRVWCSDAENADLNEALASSAELSLGDLFGAVSIGHGLNLGQSHWNAEDLDLREGNSDEIAAELNRAAALDWDRYSRFVTGFEVEFPKIGRPKVVAKGRNRTQLLIVRRGEETPAIAMPIGERAALRLYYELWRTEGRVLILDEPASRFDAYTGQEILRLIDRGFVQTQVIMASVHASILENVPPAGMFELIPRPGGLASPVVAELSSGIQRYLAGRSAADARTMESATRLAQERRAAQPLLGLDDRLRGVSKELSRALGEQIDGYYPERDARPDPKISVSDRNLKALLQRLRACPRGRAGASEFEEVCREILDRALCPPLVPVGAQLKNESGTHRRDLIYDIPTDVGPSFWLYLLTNYDAIGLVVECKNYQSEVPENEILASSKYIDRHKLGNFGLIVTRTGVSPPAHAQIVDLWKVSHRLLLVLQEEDLEELIRCADRGVDGGLVLDTALRRFRRGL